MTPDPGLGVGWTGSSAGRGQPARRESGDPEPRGFTGPGLRRLLRGVAAAIPVGSWESCDPETDPDGRACRGALATVEVLVGAVL